MKDIDDSFGVEIRTSDNIELTCFEFGKRRYVVNKFDESIDYCLNYFTNSII